ncbi:MAG: HIT domain-containing protein [Pseudomonadota bacterium]
MTKESVVGDCPFCPNNIDKLDLPLIADLQSSKLFLELNQTYRGHCILVSTPEHVTRIDQLTREQWRSLSSDIWQVQKALSTVFEPDHVNVASIGQLVPHLHWHIVPRYTDDPRWGAPIWMTRPEDMPIQRLSSVEYEDRKLIIREAIYQRDTEEWPDDVDGDLLRRLKQQHFDFESAATLYFHVAFENWPPQPAAVEVLRTHYHDVTLFDAPQGGPADEAYVELKICDLLSYKLVTEIQTHVSKIMEPFHGSCDSWGVMLHENAQTQG